MDELDRLLAGISTYQDVVLGGKTIRRGVRDCEQRWQAIEPHLPTTGVLLDVGANFGWFCLKWCDGHPDRLALALEADYRTASVARHVLAAHHHQRVFLCTAFADVAAIETLQRAGQRFDAVFCLSVLHWIPDHRAFLTALGRIADRIFIEQPNKNETGAGVAAIRESIGDIGPYLRDVFATRPVERLATWKAHLSDDLPRELWFVGPGDAPTTTRNTALDVGGLLKADVAWPPRSWWENQMSRLPNDRNQNLYATPAGLSVANVQICAKTTSTSDARSNWRKALTQIPDSGVTTFRRRLRRLIRAIRRRWRI